jgi:hypothetical protein
MHNNRPKKYRNLKVRYKIVEKTFKGEPRFALYTAEYFDGIFRFLASFETREKAVQAGELYAKDREVTS